MLDTLQYPRHLHRGGTYRIVADAAEAAEALTEGWTLSPVVSAREPEAASSADASESEHDPAAAPVALRRKPGRPRSIS